MPAPCFLDGLPVWKVVNKRKVWRSTSGRWLYTWDATHGEIEVFDKNGFHIGALDALTGLIIKPAAKGRKINVH